MIFPTCFRKQFLVSSFVVVKVRSHFESVLATEGLVEALVTCSPVLQSGSISMLDLFYASNKVSVTGLARF